MERNKPCFCGSGKKYKKCHAGINESSMAADIIREYTALDKDLKEFYAGKESVCCKGCHECCGDYFVISQVEFLIITDYLVKKGGHELLRKYIQKGMEQNNLFMEQYPEVYKMFKNSTDIVRYMSMPVPKKSVSDCIFLDEDGCCSVYDVRPWTCRTHGTCYDERYPFVEVCSHIPIAEQNRQNMFSIDKYSKVNVELSCLQIDGHEAIIQSPFPIFYWMHMCFGQGNSISSFLNHPLFYSTLHDGKEQLYWKKYRWHFGAESQIILKGLV